MSATYGLIGYPLSHSFSPVWFNKKFAAQHIDAVYHAFPLPAITDLPALLQQHPVICGLNVTIPYKESIIPYLDTLDITAKKVGAVNCVSFDGGKMTGYNTDTIGFRESLQPLLQPQHTRALVLGTGGASHAVTYVLDELGIEYVRVSRTAGQNVTTYDALTNDIVQQHTLIVNTTPLGMYPNVDACPALPYGALSREHLLYDLIYNPAITKFLELGQQAGAQIKNGQEMLELQAEASWRIWNNKD